MNHLFVLVTRPITHQKTYRQLSQLLDYPMPNQASAQAIEEVFFYQAGVQFCHIEQSPIWLAETCCTQTICTTSLELHGIHHNEVRTGVNLGGMTGFLAAYAAKQTDSQHHPESAQAILLQPEYIDTLALDDNRMHAASTFTVVIEVSPQHDPLRYREALLMAMGATNVFKSVIVVLQQDAISLVTQQWPADSMQAKLIKVLKGLPLYDVESVYFVADENRIELNITGPYPDIMQPLSSADFIGIQRRSHTLLRF